MSAWVLTRVRQAFHWYPRIRPGERWGCHNYSSFWQVSCCLFDTWHMLNFLKKKFYSICWVSCFCYPKSFKWIYVLFVVWLIGLQRINTKQETNETIIYSSSSLTKNTSKYSLVPAVEMTPSHFDHTWKHRSPKIPHRLVVSFVSKIQEFFPRKMVSRLVSFLFTRFDFAAV